ncbi:MAG: carboxypeptidase regulatory-like domain-containing protein [Planctomycetes bacterium]|nr:carboxypeptidase regulatory-like domain-containing protein [Planctomycetota bacterium]
MLKKVSFLLAILGILIFLFLIKKSLDQPEHRIQASNNEETIAQPAAKTTQESAEQNPDNNNNFETQAVSSSVSDTKEELRSIKINGIIKTCDNSILNSPYIYAHVLPTNNVADIATCEPITAILSTSYSNNEFKFDIAYYSKVGRTDSVLIRMYQQLPRRIIGHNKKDYEPFYTKQCYSYNKLLSITQKNTILDITLECIPTSKLSLIFSPKTINPSTTITVQDKTHEFPEYSFNSINGETTFVVPSGIKLIMTCVFPGYADTQLQIGPFQAGEESNIEISMEKGSLNFSGKCIDESGNPVSNVSIYASQEGMSMIYAITDAAGGFTLIGILEKPIKTITFVPNPNITYKALKIQNAAINEPLTVIIEKKSESKTSTFTGRCIDENGDPIARVYVMCTQKTEEELSGYYSLQPVFSDENGNFTITNLLNKSIHNITFSHRSYKSPAPLISNIDITKPYTVVLKKIEDK